VKGLEQQRNYLMNKLQNTKSNLESKKFAQLKEFEMEKLEMLKKIEELLSLNDILVGSKRIFDDEGNTINTLEVMSILSPAENEDIPHRNTLISFF
jgi:type II secretory pathway component HofQ